MTQTNVPVTERAAVKERVENAEREAMAERLETSYQQIRQYQDTLQQSQEQMDGVHNMFDRSQVGTITRSSQPHSDGGWKEFWIEASRFLLCCKLLLGEISFQIFQS